MRKQVKKAAAFLMAAVMALSLNIVMPREVRAAEYTPTEYGYTYANGVWDFAAVSKNLTLSAGDTLSGIIVGAGTVSLKLNDKVICLNKGTIYLPVSAGASGEITLKLGGSSGGRYISIHDATEGDHYIAYSDKNTPKVVNFTENDIETYNGQSCIKITAVGEGDIKLTKIELKQNAADVPPTPTPQDTVCVQKKQTGSTYTVRVVYEVPFSAVNGKRAIGIKYNDAATAETLVGTDVYSSLQEGGNTRAAGEGNCFVVVEITDVPNNASFTVQPVAIGANGDPTVLTQDAYELNMTELLQQ